MGLGEGENGFDLAGNGCRLIWHGRDVVRIQRTCSFLDRGWKDGHGWRDVIDKIAIRFFCPLVLFKLPDGAQSMRFRMGSNAHLEKIKCHSYIQDDRAILNVPKK